MSASPSPVLVVTGASGGLGTSTFAAALGRRAAAAFGDAVLVDLDVGGGGLDVTVGLEHLPGMRWGDLGQVRGRVDARRLVDGLPTAVRCALLSAGGAGWPGAEVPEGAVVDVLTSVVSLGWPVVLDVPARSPLTGPALGVADHVVVLTGLHARGVSDLHAVDARILRPARGGEGAGAPLLVTTGGRAPADAHEALAEHLGVVPVGHLPDDARVARSAETGEWPGGNGPFRHVADAVLALVGRRREAA